MNELPGTESHQTFTRENVTPCYLCMILFCYYKTAQNFTITLTYQTIPLPQWIWLLLTSPLRHTMAPTQNNTITIQDPTQQYRHAHVTMEYLTIPLQYTTELNCAQSNRYRIKQDRILLNHYMTAPNHTKLEFALTYRHVTEIQLATPCHYCIMHYLTLPIQHGSINDVTKPLLNWTKLH